MPIPPEFGASVSPAHTRLDPSGPGSVYVVGDVHGCIAELRALWDRLDPGRDDRVVFVGDLVRKGPASDDVVAFVEARDTAISVRGNNEDMIVREGLEADLSAASRDAVASFPLVVSWEEKLVVHGGVHPDLPLGEHTPTDLLEMRAIPRDNGYDGPFWFESYEGPPRVFFGHTVLAEPLVTEWAVGLDTGCVHGERLTAYDCDRQEWVSVPAERTYVPRSVDRVLRP
jgi:serine/threonine protein phosphatase 1